MTELGGRTGDEPSATPSQSDVERDPVQGRDGSSSTLPPRPPAPAWSGSAIAIPGPMPPPPPPRPVYGAPPGIGWLPGVPPQPREVPPPPTAAALAIPLDTRSLVREALDLLTRSDSGLRGPSFYIGFMMLVTLAPFVALFGLLVVAQPADLLGPSFATGDGSSYGSGTEGLAFLGWLSLGAIPAVLGYIGATVEARALATAVIGARAEGRPLRLVESISLARKRFWPVLGAQVLIGFITGLITTIASVVVFALMGPVEPISYGVQLLLGLLLGTPVVYVPAAIVLGGTGVFESIRRSFGLASARKRLAVVVTLFGLVSQFVVLFGLSAGLDAVARFIVGTGLTETFPPPLVVPLTAAFVFAIGTLVFLVEVIAAAPPVFAFIALTHYTWGLEAGRRDPVRVRHTWDPWMTPGLALAAGLALLALIGGVVSLPL